MFYTEEFITGIYDVPGTKMRNLPCQKEPQKEKGGGKKYQRFDAN